MLASFSEPLNRLVNGDFKEAKEAHVTLEHVDETTFAYFTQWAYTGKYEVLLPLVKSGVSAQKQNASATNSPGAGLAFRSVSPTPNAAATSSPTARSTFGSAPHAQGAAATVGTGGSLFGGGLSNAATPSTGGSFFASLPPNPTTTTGTGRGLFGSPPHTQAAFATNNVTSRPLFSLTSEVPKTRNPTAAAVPAQSGYDALWTKFTELFTDGVFGPHPASSHPRFEPVAIKSTSPLFQTENGGGGPNPLLAHARIFLLADYYDIPSLSDLSFREMGRTLLNRYKDPKSFEHSWQMENVVELIGFCWEDARPAKLRDAVVLYAACHFEKLMENETFLELHKTHPDLATDIALLLVKRLKFP